MFEREFEQRVRAAQFSTADVLVLMRLEQMAARYQ